MSQDGIIQSWLDRKASMPPFPKDSPLAVNFEKLHRGFAARVRKYGGCELYADKIDRWDSHMLLNQWTEIAAPMKSGFQVLNHGDMWLNNMMFRLDDEGNPLEVSLIDYQIPYWGSPTGDLFYFLLSSVADNIKVDHFDEFVKFYHSELVDDLRRLNYDQQVPTLTELYDDMQEKGGFGLFLLSNHSCVSF